MIDFHEKITPDPSNAIISRIFKKSCFQLNFFLTKNRINKWLCWTRIHLTILYNTKHENESITNVFIVLAKSFANQTKLRLYNKTWWTEIDSRDVCNLITTRVVSVTRSGSVMSFIRHDNKYEYECYACVLVKSIYKHKIAQRLRNKRNLK